MQYRSVARVAGVAILSIAISPWGYATVADNAEPGAHVVSAAANTVTVFKDPSCGSCKQWIPHMRTHGFTVIARDSSDMGGMTATARVPRQLYSCHTGFVNGYVIEGHVPAADVQKMLKDKPKIAGIAVAGMPAGAPGMEGPGRVDRDHVKARKR